MAKGNSQNGGSGPAKLDYRAEPPAIPFPIRSLILFVLATVVCIVGGGLLYRDFQANRALWRVEEAARTKWLADFNAAATHKMPIPGEIVTRRREDALALSALPDWSVSMDLNGTHVVACYVPIAYADLCRVDPRFESSRFSAVAFMGTLRRPDRLARLVVVDCAIDPTMEFGKPMWRITYSAAPIAKSSDPRPQPQRKPSVGALTGRWIAVELHSGVIDPNDPSHIMFGYVRSALPGTTGSAGLPDPGFIDAFLQNDDSMTFEIRDANPADRLNLRMAPRTTVQDPEVVTKIFGRPNTTRPSGG
jgi:hypothetical protein